MIDVLHTSWSDYHNKFNEHWSSHIDTKLKINRKNTFSCVENSWDLLSQQLSYIIQSSVYYTNHVAYHVSST